jgi:cellobiose-specific phosphotransferase system component IIB
MTFIAILLVRCGLGNSSSLLLLNILLVATTIDVDFFFDAIAIAHSGADYKTGIIAEHPLIFFNFTAG